MKCLPVILMLCLALALAACGKKEIVKPVPVQPTKPVEPTKPADPVGSSDTHKDGDVERLIFNQDNGVNIVVLGDGFTKDDLKINGVFDTKVNELLAYLFSVAPFKQYKNYFNAYAVYAQSNERGAAKAYLPGTTTTRFHSYFYPGIDRLLMAGDANLAYSYVEKAMPVNRAHLIIMLVNDETYGGSGGSIAVISAHNLSKYIMVHESGHTFAGMGDEYVDLPIANNYSTDLVPYIPNIDNTNNIDSIKWKGYFDLPAYKPYIDAFEGAYYRDKGFYRPERRSVMTDLGVASFNAPSREAIARRITGIVGIPFDMDAFLKADASSVTPILTTGSIKPPANDFVDMRKRLMQLQQERKQWNQ